MSASGLARARGRRPAQNGPAAERASSSSAEGKRQLDSGASTVEAGENKPTVRGLYRRRMSQVADRLAPSMDLEFDRNPFRRLRRRCLIAAAPRTGSHLLCENLLQHGVVIQEFFDIKRIIQVCDHQTFFSLQDYCDYIIDMFAVKGIFGVKGGVKILAPLKLAGEFPQFKSEWRFVYLTRQNFVAQGISEYKARLTGAYKSTRAPARKLVEDDYNAEKIAKQIEANLLIYKTWEQTFRLFELEPHRITYEMLAKDPAGIAAAAAEYMGLDGAPINDERFVSAPLKVQADDLSSRWEARFREEYAEFCAARS
jgi:LPS sulfotransferase NodH